MNVNEIKQKYLGDAGEKVRDPDIEETKKSFQRQLNIAQQILDICKTSLMHYENTPVYTKGFKAVIDKNVKLLTTVLPKLGRY